MPEPSSNSTGKLFRHFVNIGYYGKGSIFGLGEELQDRIIVAKTRVQCLLLPRYWLFQKEQNMNNIWNRTKLFLEANVPGREKLFEEFLVNRSWARYKRDLVKAVPKREIHKTTKSNVPLICRIEKGL